MKKLIFVFILALVVLGTAACLPHVDGNYPGVRTEARVTDKDYENQVLATADFKVTTNRWFDLQSFEEERERNRNLLSAGNNSEVMAAFEGNLPATTIQIISEVKQKQAAFVMLNFWINPDVDINFQQAGCLILTLRNPNGETVEVRDKGCLFTFIQMGKKSHYLDSAKESVIFNSDFDFAAVTKKRPNVVCVRLDKQYFSWQIVSLELDLKKIFINTTTIANTP